MISQSIPTPPLDHHPNFIHSNDHSPQQPSGMVAPPGGLSRSSRTSSLALLAANPPPSPPYPDSPNSASPWGGSSRANSPTPPSSLSGPSSVGTSYSPSRNPGFVVTSRPKSYNPPPSPNPPPPIALPAPLAQQAPSYVNSSSAASSTYINQGAPLSHNPSTSSSRSSPGGHGRTSQRRPSRSGGESPPSAASTLEPKTTLTLSSSIDSKGRRMVNQYVRLKTIGQGSHGKVWLCAEPTLKEMDEDELSTAEEANLDRQDSTRSTRSGKQVARWQDELDSVDVKYCAIKSVAREGARGKSLRHAKGRKAAGTGSSGGIGADDKVKREVAIMKRLDHKNVVRLKEVIDDVKSKKVFMVLEFMAGGQIVWQDEHGLPAMTVDEARRTFRDVVLGLEYLHYQGIIHRDIKPANLLWTEDHSTVKISDFGVSHVSDALLRATPDSPEGGDDDKALRKTAGSPAFFAPELCHPSEYTPTPTQLDSTAERDNPYFSREASGSGGEGAVYTPTSPNGIKLTSTRISLPLRRPDPSTPRTRPSIGKGIDVWALGVTLFCLLFGETPFMARTEYELYNVIANESIPVPERMGREGAWTGSGPGWEGAGDGVEGRQVVDLLSRLLEKDPAKRISLEEVKKHPWVLRNLSSSPDSWLCDTDPAQNDTVIVTEEDVQQATQERGAIDTLPLVRNRPRLRRALHAALVRFPAFSRMTSTSTRATTGGRSRSKSASSTSQSVLDGASETASSEKPSRHPSDATSRKKSSAEFGVDIRRIISGGRDSSPHRTNSTSSNANSAIGGGRGGWGARQRPKKSLESSTASSSTPTTPQLPFLSRSVSANSTSNARSHFLPPHIAADRESRTSSSASGASSLRGFRSDSPALGNSDVESNGGRTGALGKWVSKFGGRKTPRPARKSSLSDDESVSVAGSASATEETEQYASRRRSTLETSLFDPSTLADDDADTIDSTDFEYSSEDDDDDDFGEPPLGRADGISGWQSDFSTFKVNPGHSIIAGLDDDDLVIDGIQKTPSHPPATFTLSDSTPRASQRDIELDPPSTLPPLVRQSSETPSKKSNNSNKDGSLKNVARDDSPPVLAPRKWSVYTDSDGEDDEGQEIFVAPRRRRAGTVGTAA